MHPLSTQHKQPIIAQLIFIGLVLLIVGMQIVRFAPDNFREDEAWVVAGVAGKNPVEIIDWISSGVHPPGWLLVADQWVNIAGVSEGAMRYLSAMFTALALALLYRWALDIGSRRFALLTVLVLGCIPFFVFYTHELRPYPALLMSSIGLMLTFFRWVQRPSRLLAILYILFGVFGLYSHYFAVYTILAQIVFFVLFVPWNRQRYIRTFGLWVAIGVCFLPWVTAIIRGFTETYSGGIFYALPTNVAGLQLVFERMTLQPAALALILVVVGVVLATPISKERLTKPIRWQTNWHKAYVLLLIVGIVGLAFLLNLLIRNVTARNLISILAPLAVVVAWGLCHLPRGARWAAVIVLVLSSIGSYQRYEVNQPYREIAETIAVEYEPGDPIVTEVQGAWRWLQSIPLYLLHHLPGGARFDHMAHVIDDVDQYLKFNGDPPYDIPNFITTADETVPIAEQVIGEHERLWLVTAGETTELGMTLHEWIDARYVMVGNVTFAEGYPLPHGVVQYRRIPADVQEVLRFGEATTLQRWQLTTPNTVAACNHIALETWWQADAVPIANYSLTAVLVDADGQGVANTDAAPGNTLMQLWQAGQYHLDTRNINIPCDLPPGEYPLLLGLYDSASGESLPISDANGGGLGTLAYLTTIVVE